MNTIKILRDALKAARETLANAALFYDELQFIDEIDAIDRTLAATSESHEDKPEVVEAAPVGAVKPWHEKFYEQLGHKDYVNNPDEVDTYKDTEIADLRAALADPVTAGELSESQIKEALRPNYVPEAFEFAWPSLLIDDARTVEKAVRAALSKRGTVGDPISHLMDAVRRHGSTHTNAEILADYPTRTERGAVGEPVQVKPVIDVWIDPHTKQRSLLDHGTPLAPFDKREFVGSLVWSTDPQDEPINAENLKLRPAPVGDVGLPVQASIGDDPKFMHLLHWWGTLAKNADTPAKWCAVDGKLKEVIAYIDAQRDHAAPQVVVPYDERESLHAWLRTMANNGEGHSKTADAMRARVLLLAQASPQAAQVIS